MFDQRIGDVSGRGKLAADMREIWVMQPRFDTRTGSSPLGMVMQQRFRAGFDFLRLRADVGEVDEALAQWWQDFQMADDVLREDLIAQAREEQRQKQKTAQPRKTVRTAQTGEASALENLVAEGDAPAKKKRRRRRKPAGAGGAASAAGKAEA